LHDVAVKSRRDGLGAKAKDPRADRSTALSGAILSYGRMITRAASCAQTNVNILICCRTVSSAAKLATSNCDFESHLGARRPLQRVQAALPPGVISSVSKQSQIAADLSLSRFNRACKTNGADAYGEVVLSWHPLLMLSRAEASSAQPGYEMPFNLRGDGGKQELVTRETTYKPFQPLRGNAG